MIIECSYCKKKIGEKPPLDDTRISSSICHLCCVVIPFNTPYYRPTDYHRSIANRYYNCLILKFALPHVLKHTPQIKRIIWSKKGLKLMEEHLRK